MPVEADEFGGVLQLWKDENSKPWGRLRYETARLNIARHTQKKVMRVLDVGGGDGMDAIYYAKLGHLVTLTDCSPTMLAEAERFAEKEGVSDRLTLYQTEQDSLPDLGSGQYFDLILCHMMIEFVPDAHAYLRKVCKLLAKGGLISILDTNRYSDVFMSAIQSNNIPDAIKAVERKEYFHPWVKRLTPRFSADDFIDQLDINGCTLVGHYGVLNICAYLPNEPKFDPQYYRQLQDLEYQMTDKYPYPLLARFFQVIGRKKNNRVYRE